MTKQSQDKELSSDRIIAGSLFDLMGMLTTQDEAVTFGASHDASVAVKMLERFAEKRGLNLDDADVAGWHTALATSPQLPVAEQPAGQAVNAKEWLRQESSVYALNDRGVNSDYISVQQACNRNDRAATNDLAERIRMLLSRHLSPVAQMSGDLVSAAQQALEALETYVAVYNEHWQRGMDILEPIGDRALADLRNALASHPSNVFHVGTPSSMPMDAAVSMLKKGLSSARAEYVASHHSNAAATVQQVVQAPVGWIAEQPDGHKTLFTHEPAKSLSDLWKVYAIYAAPHTVAADVPNDSQIIKCAAEAGVFCTMPQALDFGRRVLTLTTASNAGEAKQGEDK